MLQRTQIMLDHQTKQDLLELALLTDQSMSELVRRFVVYGVQEEKKKPRKKRVNPVKGLLALAQKAEEIDALYGDDGPTDWSVNHDHYLYGLPKKQK